MLVYLKGISFADLEPVINDQANSLNDQANNCLIHFYKR